MQLFFPKKSSAFIFQSFLNFLVENDWVRLCAGNIVFFLAMKSKSGEIFHLIDAIHRTLVPLCLEPGMHLLRKKEEYN